ncbi:MAG TPA: hypothetical protein PLO78_05045 [Candidatus Omnitrophota bacterium]|nr:hypothetical protein [Candidatus Omnitrophota bacterium]
MKYERGSVWRKWDLHVHSPASFCNGFSNWDSYFKKLDEVTKQKEIKVIGVTDYFSIDGYEKLITDYKGKLGSVELILPNIEFRLDNIVCKRGNKEPKRLNFHVIFSDEVSPQDIKAQFLGDLHFYKGSGSAGELSKIKLDKKAIEDYGKECRKQADFKHDTDLSAGTKNIVFKIDEIVNALRNKPDYFKGKYLLFLESEFWSDIDWGQDYGLRKTLLQISHGIFNSNPNDIAWFLGKDKASYAEPKEFIAEFGRLFPCVHGSDAHTEQELETRPDLERFCWIKADPTFIGLKQVVLEPEDRIHIGKMPAKGKNLANVIDKVEIANSNGWFEETPLPLNEDLVAIIGEKGAGKTALADFIALACGDFELLKGDASSFVFKALTPTKQIEKTIDKCKVTIRWKEGDPDEIVIDEELTDYKTKKKVKYLSQSFIENRCRPEHADELRQEIENIVFQYIPISDRLGQTTFADLKRLRTRSVEVEKSSCKKLIFELNGEIAKLREEIGSLEIQRTTKKKTEEEIAQLNEQKPKPADAEEKAIEDKLTILYAKKNEINEKIAECKLQLSTIESIETKVSTLSQHIEKELSDIKTDLDSIGLGGIHSKLKFTVDPEFKTKLEEARKKLTGQIIVLEGATEEASPVSGKDKKIGEITSDYINKLSLSGLNAEIAWLEAKSSIASDARNVIKDFEDKIEKNKKTVSALEKNIAEIEQTKMPILAKKIEDRKTTYKNYFILLQKEKEIFEALSAPIKAKIDAENVGEKQIGYSARIEFDVNGFYDKACEVVNFKASGRYHQDDKQLFKDIKSIAEKIELVEDADTYNLLVERFMQAFGKEDGKGSDAENQFKKGKRQIDFDAWLFGVSFFSVTYSIKYQNTYIELLSPGKKGIVLLLMYLTLDAKSGIPLIIDQPEENLDNKSVYAHLIDYFRQAKKRRQIIVVTHNPNLVLNTDAEQVIVADFQVAPSAGQARIRYVSGAIENSFINNALKDPLKKQGIREHGAEILEGGKKAFIHRKDKYEY